MTEKLAVQPCDLSRQLIETILSGFILPGKPDDGLSLGSVHLLQGLQH